ncbi:uncharacterized protein LOC123722983 [Papilio machaon]|uniref:uncharacterized protein LOC123722983 n=1 Tax=Papilio machaon TaxID=76193 RepID=UPI001E663876|nr:uncharacterized protein LOC123722983 [Papilio machaon]
MDLSLPAVVNAMVGSESSWNAVASFCEEVMALKEAAERRREEDAAADPLRRRRDGRRRQAHTRRLPPVRTINGYIVTLLQAKSKVAPIKQKITLPRLELNAALLLARLLKKIRDTLRCDQIDLNMWSDSMITLGWIKGNPGRWNKFVGIRVSEIRNLTVPEKWNYVKSSENPAVIISRGSEPNALQENKLWWEGPLWLKKQNIPMKRVIIDTHEEEIRSYHASTEEESNLWDRFSELQRMLRVLTYCRRVFSKNKSNKTLQVVEIQETLHKLLKIIQQREFETEYNALLKGGTVGKKGRIAALDPFIDEEGLIRVGGRLSNSTLTYNQKHPIILPFKHHVTDLLIRDAHKETLHGGNQATLCYIRNKYWILGIKRRIKTVLNKCVKCIRYKGVNTHQKMGQLPTARVTPSHPFSSSGVDYAGPIQVRTTKGRGHKSYKGYIALFVCLATKAIHLELVSDMTTSSFLAAFRRFTARRGHCYHMYSDNGTYFVKAAKTLQHEVLEITQKPHLQDIITNIGTQWHFIPTHSPHFGGLWERGVRSMKHHLKRTIGEATLTFEELTTLLCQIESCLNSRPLCKMDENIESMQALTPSHFLIGREAVGIPDPIEQCIIREPTLRWKMIQKIKKEFWKSWTSDYLNQLQQKYKWRSQGPNVKPGDIVGGTDTSGIGESPSARLRLNSRLEFGRKRAGRPAYSGGGTIPLVAGARGKSKKRAAVSPKTFAVDVCNIRGLHSNLEEYQMWKIIHLPCWTFC